MVEVVSWVETTRYSRIVESRLGAEAERFTGMARWRRAATARGGARDG
jgi:hypothetical protein